jgi:hypothetical protein
LNTKKHYLKRTLCISSIMLTALLAGCNSSSSSDNSGDKSSGPTVIETNPAVDATAVPLNHKVIATFSEAMDSTTIDTQSFTVEGADNKALNGTISVDAASHTATYTPGLNFNAGTDYTATLTTAIRTTAGSVALAENKVWHFKSGTAEDDVLPIVDSTNPADTVTGVAPNRPVTANFSEALDSATVNKSTFTLSYASDGSKVLGDVIYSKKVATFNPSNNLDTGTEYTATLTTGISDLADNQLAATADTADNKLTAKVWSFETGVNLAEGPKPVDLRTAGDFAILTKTGITNVFESAIDGNIGASPITAKAIKPTCAEVTGLIYGADAAYAEADTCGDFKGDAAANTLVHNAVLDMGTAYTDAAGRTTPDYTELHAGDISGKTLVPGLYKWGTDVLINEDVYLDGDANDVWIFQISGDVIQASGTEVVLMNDVQAKNIFWQVGGGTGVALDTTSIFNGIVLAEKAINVKTGATVNGRLLSQTEVTLQKNKINQP